MFKIFKFISFMAVVSFAFLNLANAATSLTLAKKDYALGEKYVHGIGKNYAKADYWFKESAHQGYIPAEYQVGNAYLRALGVPFMEKLSEYWLLKAGKQGYAPAEYDLGFFYHEYLAFSTFSKKRAQFYNKISRYWYRKAAAQNDAKAEMKLASMYATGHGAPKNTVEAEYWLEKSANGENQLAEFALATVEYYGEGVPQNSLLAIQWWEKSEKDGGKLARLAKANIQRVEKGDNYKFGHVVP